MAYRFVEKAHLVQTRATLCIVNGAFPALGRALEALSVHVLPTSLAPARSAVGYHPDVVAHHLGGAKIMLADEGLRLRVTQYGFTVLPCAADPYRGYPAEIALNALRLGTLLFCRLQLCDRMLLQYCQSSGVRPVPVSQGYAKCSCAVVDGKSLITSDHSIARACTREGIDCLLIRPGHIALPGYSYGFIGGSCFLLQRDLLVFFGNIGAHPDYPAIRDFCNSKGVKVECLLSGSLTDCGSVLPLMEQA